MDALKHESAIITAALPYANADLHLGHIASTYLPADILYRYFKLKGRKAVQVCASDDFGTPILIAAEKAGKKPSEYVALWNRRFREDLAGLGIEYDIFDSTSSPENVALAQDFFGKLRENGHIFASEIDQFYCEFDKKFLPDRYVKGRCPYCGAEDQYSDGCENCGRTLQPGQILGPHCAICGRPPALRKSSHYFFRLSTFSEKLKEWLEGNGELQPDAKNYVLNWIKDGLQDWDITRDLEWGVPIPLAEAKGKVLYGWFDNHLCYITAAAKAARKLGEDGSRFWNNSKVYHFIGKDIVYHHYLFLPSMRIGDGRFKLPDLIPTRGHLLIQGRKISKSRHWSVTIRDFLGIFPADYLRFYLTRVVPYSQADADFDWRDFKEKINNELVASVGNFVYRTLVFVKNNFGGVVPKPAVEGGEETDVLREVERSSEESSSLIEQGHYDRALRRVLEFSSRCNQYFQRKAPWEDEEERPTTIYYACNFVASLALLLSPFLPDSSEDSWRQLCLEGGTREAGWAAAHRLNVRSAQRIGSVRPLFRKVEDEDVEKAEKLLR